MAISSLFITEIYAIFHEKVIPDKTRQLILVKVSGSLLLRAPALIYLTWLD